MTLLEMLEEQGLLSVELTEDDLNLDFHFTERGSYTTFNALEHGIGEYIVTIERSGYNWIVFAEEHEPEDLDLLGIKSTHKTLKNAKKIAIEFAGWFQFCEWEYIRQNDPDE